MEMGKRRKKDKHLPRRVYNKHGAFYFVTYENKWIRLGETEPEMLRALADLDNPSSGTMSKVLTRYANEVLPTKGIKTQKDQRKQLERLRRAFGHMSPRHIRPSHIAAYMDKRSAKVSANREVALLSHAFKKAIRWGYLDINPCASVERHTERPSREYVEDEQFMAAYRDAPPPIRYAMAIAYLTGQRQADVLNLHRRQFSDEGITFIQAKTGMGVLVKWSPALTRAVNRALNYGTPSIGYVIHDGKGNKYSPSGFQSAWQRLMVGKTYRFKFMSIRAKARTDGEDKGLLGHADPEKMARIYQRKPRPAKPVR